MEYVSRQGWGATVNPVWQPLITPVQTVWLHTGAVRLRNIGDPVEERAHVRSYEKTALSRQWRGVGYSWLVGQSGNVYEGRGWHKSGANYGASNLAAVSICVIGHGDYEPLGDAARNSILTILKVTKNQFSWNGETLKGHREEPGVSKSCPGKYPFDFVLEYRNGDYPLSGGSPTPAPPQKGVYVHGLHRAPHLKITKPWTHGQGVRSCQALLKRQWRCDPGTIDGVYGPGTNAAVREFQRREELMVDGIVGPKTWFALFADPDRNLALRSDMMKGDDVGAVQAVVGVRVDGRYGPQTTGAVKSFQKTRGLKEDGIVGPVTRAAMAGVKT